MPLPRKDHNDRRPLAAIAVDRDLLGDRGTTVGGERIEPLTWSLSPGIAQFPAAVREVRAVGASVSALKTPKHRLMPIRTVSRCKWLTQNARETSLGSAICVQNREPPFPA